MYPGPAPLPEIFLAELSGNNIKVHAAEVGAEGQKALEQSESTFSTLQGDVESGSRWTVAGDGRMLVAGSLAPQEDPPRRILLGAPTSKEYAPSSFLLRGQSPSETLSPERTPPGGLDSFVYLSFPPASGRIDVSIADADSRQYTTERSIQSFEAPWTSSFALNLSTSHQRQPPHPLNKASIICL
ncbi:hypothetical protein V496_05067 [Pseudogymnoascus sp. VKM F-4515 (FW-2607)]|nr:hypothetical protein V496_05067 [Pseudogymnoascus sp. VKM F-4515 (FW-2607)]